ncbi:zinc finger protein-domain-containing protein [Aspergillus crustosus]
MCWAGGKHRNLISQSNRRELLISNESFNNMKPHLRRIGAGFCGTIWAAVDDGPAYKREDGGPDRSLKNDHDMHQLIQHSLKQVMIQVPVCYNLLTPADSWWNENLALFPPGYEPCSMIHAQRIPPINEETRRFITERYCPQQLIAEILVSDANHDCLIRPYLGRRRVQAPQSHSRFKAFSLRNYPLHVDQMEEIGIPEGDMIRYARTMAEALAMMHWVAEVDANDVEFVLAAPNHAAASDNSTPKPYSNVLGQHHMWMLDFDLVRTMTMDENGIQQAVKAFWKNDPFFPRPNNGHSRLWGAFREQYLETSIRCISEKRPVNREKLALPAHFIHSLEERDHKSADN